jgi:hypothetical protein
MNSIFKKLNFKDQKEILILNYPDSFKSDLEEMESLTKIRKQLRGVEEISFCLIFVMKKQGIDDVVPKIVDLLIDDAVLWFAYPKGTSKKYKCDFNRDTGWEILGEHGYEGVRMVAIDEDWSALRFRKAENIKTMKRRNSMAMSREGQRKTKGR